MTHKTNIGASYDDAADVLYLYLKRGALTKNFEEEAGLILRYDQETKAPVGATIVDYKEYWLPRRRQHLATRLASFFGVKAKEADVVLKAVK